MLYPHAQTPVTRRTALIVGGGALGAVGLGWGFPAAARTEAGGDTWPAKRGDPDVIRQRFGARSDLLAQGLRQGDPLADAVVEELRNLGTPGRETLHAGIKNGLASLKDPPPAITALLRQAESVPHWSSQGALEQGSRTFLTVYPAAHALTLSLRSLVHTYRSPAIAGVLVGTYELISKTKQRLLETTDWLVRIMLPGGLERGADGYVATLQVRMLHAESRARALRAGWDADTWGVPISQVDLFRTWLDFNYLAYPALTRLGYDFTQAELTAVYRMWWHLGHLLGIDPDFYLGVTDHGEAARMLDLVDATNEPPDHNSRALIRATVQATIALATDWGFPEPLARDVVHATFPYLNGGQMARDHGIPPAAATALLPPGAVANAALRALQRAVGPAWNQQIHQNEKDLRHFLAQQPPAEYATHGGSTARTMTVLA